MTPGSSTSIACSLPSIFQNRTSTDGLCATEVDLQISRQILFLFVIARWLLCFLIFSGLITNYMLRVGMSHNAKGPSSKSDQFLTWHAMYCNALQCIQNKPDLKKKPTHSMTNVSQVNMSIAIVQMVKQVQEVNQMIKKIQTNCVRRTTLCFVKLSRCLVLQLHVIVMIFLCPELHWYCRSDPEWLAWQCIMVLAVGSSLAQMYTGAL